MTDDGTPPLPVFPPLYAVVDAELSRAHGFEPPALAKIFLDEGVSLLQLRAKSAAGADFLAWTDDIVSHAAGKGAMVIVNDRADIARLGRATGAHVGQDDLPLAAVRELLGPNAIIGLSTHTPGQIDAACREAVSYIAVGPIFETGTKSTGYKPVGLGVIRYAVSVCAPIPVVAIGGITLERAPEVLAAGAQSVVVISDLLIGADPARRVREYRDRLSELS